MFFSHPRGLYSIMVDTTRRIVYEAPVGTWTKDDYSEYHDIFKNVIVPTLGQGEWSLCTDFRKYKISDIGDLMNDHIDWLSENNVRYSGLIVDSAMIRMQINKAMRAKIPQKAFLDEAEADEWLKSLGF